ncbi:hypothetical protein [Gemmatimonas sp.]|uniref:hypothetical protein n=1 Tax=Gemmatimonas sp. TaxID=1962908 RepID=UPI003563C574
MSVTVAGAAWRYGSPLRVDLLQRLNRDSVAFDRVATSERVLPSAAALVALSATAATIPLADSLPPTSAGVADSITWTPAVARTWVNVRNDASRGGEVVGVIKPASRAMLGTDRAGWRQVRSPDVTGWVDPRLFAPDSLRIRGE